MHAEHADWSVLVDTTALAGHSCGGRPTHKQASIGTDYTEKKIKPQITQRRKYLGASRKKEV
jgi:hypothetical protein